MGAVDEIGSKQDAWWAEEAVGRVGVLGAPDVTDAVGETGTLGDTGAQGEAGAQRKTGALGETGEHPPHIYRMGQISTVPVSS